MSIRPFLLFFCSCIDVGSLRREQPESAVLIYFLVHVVVCDPAGKEYSEGSGTNNNIRPPDNEERMVQTINTSVIRHRSPIFLVLYGEHNAHGRIQGNKTKQ